VASPYMYQLLLAHVSLADLNFTSHQRVVLEIDFAGIITVSETRRNES